MGGAPRAGRRVVPALDQSPQRPGKTTQPPGPYFPPKMLVSALTCGMGQQWWDDRLGRPQAASP